MSINTQSLQQGSAAAPVGSQWALLLLQFGWVPGVPPSTSSVPRGGDVGPTVARTHSTGPGSVSSVLLNGSRAAGLTYTDMTFYSPVTMVSGGVLRFKMLQRNVCDVTSGSIDQVNIAIVHDKDTLERGSFAAGTSCYKRPCSLFVHHCLLFDIETDDFVSAVILHFGTVRL